MNIKFTIIVPQHLTEILFLLAHHRTSNIVGVFATQKQKQFYDFAILNLKYTNIFCETFTSVKANPASVNGKIVVLMDIPHNFETLRQVLAASKGAEETIVILMKENKKYINMASKKIGEGFNIVTTSDYSKNQLVGINSKLRDLVDQSYDMNRAAFYAYGAYLNYFRSNLLKFIFKTQAIDVAALAKSFGFPTPPRVKDGKFLKVSVRKQKVNQKRAQKKVLKKKGPVQESIEGEMEYKKPKTKKLSIKQIAHLKTKKILKNKIVVLKPKSKVPKTPK